MDSTLLISKRKVNSFLSDLAYHFSRCNGQFRIPITEFRMFSDAAAYCMAAVEPYNWVWHQLNADRNYTRRASGRNNDDNIDNAFRHNLIYRHKRLVGVHKLMLEAGTPLVQKHAELLDVMLETPGHALDGHGDVDHPNSCKYYHSAHIITADGNYYHVPNNQHTTRARNLLALL